MDAATILQSYLDEVSVAVLADDWDSYRDAVSLPCHIVSHDESKVVATVEELKAGYDQFRGTLQAQRVTDYVRLVETAARLDPDLISGSYLSHIISNGNRVLLPFQSQMTLRLQGNRWRAASVTNALANSRWPLVRLALHPETDPKEGPET